MAEQMLLCIASRNTTGMFRRKCKLILKAEFWEFQE